MGTSAASHIDWFRVAGSVALVLALLAVLWWTLRRLRAMRAPGGSEQRLQVLETVSLGPRQKIALLRVANQQVLIGISPSQFTALGSWEQPPVSKGSDLEN